MNEFNVDSTCPYGKKFVFFHRESQWDCSKIKISKRSWTRTSLRIKNLIKPHQKSRTSSKFQDLGQDRIEILIEILNEKKILIFSVRVHEDGKSLNSDQVLEIRYMYKAIIWH